ncbi:MAG: hypothetical protein GXP30_00130, partial [Verrucomicrobia bacterium]|nr:hypothetical protein [Verrucomicrobiota bacterium]
PLPLADTKMDMFFSATQYRLETHQNILKIDQAGPARYSFRVQAPGCATYTQIEPITVTQEQEILIKLEPGFKFKYSLDSKNTGNFSVSLMHLSIDAKGLEQWEEILRTYPNSEFSYWDHLAPGKYQMIVYDRSITPFKTSETNFEIKFNDPEIVDLGKIAIPH